MDKKTKHTPGPWFCFPHEEGAFDVGTGSDQNKSDILCSRYNWLERSEEMHANARLIAAAPDLLNAVEAFLDYDSDKQGDAVAMMIAYADALRLAKEAHSKATGAA